MNNSSFLVQVTTPWPPFNYKFGPIQLTSDPRIGLSDALLCVWRPMHMLQEFTGPKCLYNCEPFTNGKMGPLAFNDWKPLMASLGEDEWLYHAHPDLNCRVPHATHRKIVSVAEPVHRIRKAIAVVSNAGGSPQHRWAALEERNSFATSTGVDLFGRPDRWRSYRSNRWSLPRTPNNFRGALGGNWGDEQKVLMMSNYHAAVCMENTQEPYYFTEKFLDAVFAGCVPIYRAHPTVREAFLQGAAWIDPADYGGNVNATIEAALAADRQAMAEQNARWLRSPAVAATSEKAVYLRIASILHARAAQFQR